MHKVPSVHAENGGREPFKPAGSFGQPRRDSANRGGTHSDGGPHKKAGGVKGDAAAQADNKELMHVLESTLITWTKQIKNVLKKVS